MISKITERQKATKLRKNGSSIKEIAKKLHVSKSSVSIWTKSVTLTTKQRELLQEKERLGGIKGRKRLQLIWKKYRQNHPKPAKIPKQPRYAESFFNTWTPEMAYILGYFAADGYLYKNKRGSCYLGFLSTDQELILAVKKIMGVTNKIEVREYDNIWKTAYILQIGSKVIFSRLVKLGFTPNKSLTLKFPAVPDQYLSNFFLGYFDGDGCAFVGHYLRKDRQRGYRNVLNIRLTSGSYCFLKELQTRLSKVCSVGQGSLHSHGATTYELTYSYKDVVKLYDFMYHSKAIPFLKRKYEILSRGIGIGTEV